MARVENSLRDKVQEGNSYAQRKQQEIDKKLQEMDNFDNKYQTYNFENSKVNQLKADLMQQGKDELTKAIQTLLWVAEKIPNYTAPTTAFTDAEIDNEDLNIRTHEA